MSAFIPASQVGGKGFIPAASSKCCTSAFVTVSARWTRENDFHCSLLCISASTVAISCSCSRREQRARRQAASPSCCTICASGDDVGESAANQPAWCSRYILTRSPGRTNAAPVSPCVARLLDDLDLPLRDRGPVDRIAFSLAA